MLGLHLPGWHAGGGLPLAIEGHLEIGTSRTLLAEFGRVLAGEFGWSPDRVEAAVAQLTRIATVVEATETVQVITADPADDRVLEAGRVFDIDVIVSGDHHLLGLGTWSEIEIILPAECLARWGP